MYSENGRVVQRLFGMRKSAHEFERFVVVELVPSEPMDVCVLWKCFDWIAKSTTAVTHTMEFNCVVVEAVGIQQHLGNL